MATSTLSPVPTPQQRRAARTARAAEDDALRYPEDQAECLLEAAYAWRLAGNPERAIAVLSGWPTWPDPTDAGLARVDIAESLYAVGRDVEADQVLVALRAERPDLDVCNAAAELCEERGQREAALGWYDVAVSRMTDEERARATSPDGWFTGASLVARGRQRLRGELGLSPDVLDRSVPPPPDLSRLRAPRTSFPTSAQLDDHDAPLTGCLVRTLFWPRQELPVAQQRWPELLEGELTSYHDDLERRLRDLASRTGRQIALVPARVALLEEYVARTGQSATDSTTRHAFMEERAAAGDSVAWPPARNELCWCASGGKYKKCCGGV